MKNLLEPEVGLATSMLETLREATEEEYQDALARDAARSSDAIPEESATNVVIIVKPRDSDNEDDFVSEASNVKEARCVQPIGTSLGKMRSVSKPLRTLPDFFSLPKARQPGSMHMNLWGMDSNVGASNVQGSVVDMDGGAAESKPRTPLFKLRTPLKENVSTDVNDGSLKTPTLFDKLEQSLKNRPNLLERLNLPQIQKIKVDNPLRKANNNINTNSDPNPAPKDVQELIENEESKEDGLFKFNQRPLMLKNLLKLKDVELIPKTIPNRAIFKSEINTKDISLPTSVKRDAEDKCESSIQVSSINEKLHMPRDVQAANENSGAQRLPSGDFSLQNIDKSVIESEDSQDALTSPSEIVSIAVDSTSTNIVESEEIDCNDLISEEIITSTTESILKNLEDADWSNETLDPTHESEIKDTTVNDDKNNINQDCEADEVTESENEDSDTDSSSNIENEIAFTSQENKDSISLPQLQKPEEDTSTLSDNGDDDFTSVQRADNIKQIDETVPTEIGKNIITKIKSIPPMSETLSNIRDNVKKSFEFFNKVTVNDSIAKVPEDTKTDTPITDDLDQEPRNDASFEKGDNFENEVKENPDQVSFNDLQKLSDDLLVLSTNSEQNFTPKVAEVEDDSSEYDLKSNETQQQTDKTEPDSLEANPITIPEVGIPKDASAKLEKKKACRIGFNKPKPQINQQSKSVSQDENTKDMAIEASAPTANILPHLLDPMSLNEQLGSSLFQNMDPLDPLNLNEKLGSPLIPNLDPLNLSEKLSSPIFREIDTLNLNGKLGSSLLPYLDPLNVRSSLQDIIVQPTIPLTDDPLNLFGKPMIEVFKLPTLDDLRRRLSSVFEVNDRSAENNFSDEEADGTNDEPVEMASAASTTNSRKVPSIRPLEDLNVDIFQFNPPSFSHPDFLSKVPRLNLNNFRAKLPIPNNLDLKPVKLESRIGNNKGNMLGASLTFGPDKKSSRKAKPIHSNLLGYPLGNLPSLDELRNTMQSDTHNLLGSHLHPNLDLFRGSNFGSSSISNIDEIRRNAQNTMKSLQQKMKSTFKAGQISNPLSEKFAKPQDLFEDVNDKLKAIHYDLNDRLSTIHEDFLDQSRLKPLVSPARIPTFPTNINSNRHVMNNFRKKKTKPSRLQTSASATASQEIELLENSNNRNSAGNNINFLRPQARSSPKKVQSNLQRKLDGAESSPVPTKVEFPKHITTIGIPKKSTLLPLSQRLPSLTQGSENLLQNVPGKPLLLARQPSFVKDLKRPSHILGKSSPFKDKTSKVTITFATTTPSPVTSPVEKFRTTSPIKISKPDIHMTPDRETLQQRPNLPRPKIISNAKPSATESTPLRFSTPFKSKNNFKNSNSDIKDIPQLQNLEPIEDTKLKFSSSKGIKDSKLRLNENNANRLNSAWTFDNNKPETRTVDVTEKPKTKPLVWPKTGEDSFLAKVRGAMQARLNSFNSAKYAQKVEIAKVEKVVSPTDMIRSASENNAVLVQDPLKESVPYTCRMTCTREK